MNDESSSKHSQSGRKVNLGKHVAPYDAKALWDLYVTQQNSILEIAKKLGMGYTTIYYWMKKHSIPRRSRSIAITISAEKKAGVTNLGPISDKDYGYLLGVLAGDGSISEETKRVCYDKRDGHYYRARNYSIRLSTAEKEFADAFRKVLHKATREKCHTYDRPSARKFYVWLNSKKWHHHFSIYKNAGFRQVLSMSDSMKAGFVSGFFDSEGGVYLHRAKRGFMYRSLRAHNKNRSLLLVVRQCLGELGIPAVVHLSHKKTRMYTVNVVGFGGVYGLQRAFRLFLEYVGFRLKRKKAKLMKSMKLFEKGIQRRIHALRKANLVRWNVFKQQSPLGGRSQHQKTPRTLTMRTDMH